MLSRRFQGAVFINSTNYSIALVVLLLYVWVGACAWSFVFAELVFVRVAMTLSHGRRPGQFVLHSDTLCDLLLSKITGGGHALDFESNESATT